MEEYNKVKKPIPHTAFVKKSSKRKRQQTDFANLEVVRKKKRLINRVCLIYNVWNEVASHHNVSIWQTLILQGKG